MSRHLMARFRHLRVAGGMNFDWREHPDGGYYEAKLENGDWMTVHRHPEAPAGEGGWLYHLLGPKHDTRNNRDTKIYWHLDEDPHHIGSEVLGGINLRDEPHDSPQQAMHAAEQHYLGLGRKSSDPGGASRDYDINDIMRRFDGGEL